MSDACYEQRKCWWDGLEVELPPTEDQPSKTVKLWARRVWTLELSLVRPNTFICCPHPQFLSLDLNAQNIIGLFFSSCIASLLLWSWLSELLFLLLDKYYLTYAPYSIPILCKAVYCSSVPVPPSIPSHLINAHELVFGYSHGTINKTTPK
jgi:hypothetical protein